MSERGPIYGALLLDKLPLSGDIFQQMPSKADLQHVQRFSERTVAGFEVLTDHYRLQCEEVARLTELIQSVIDGKWSVTGLQEAIGDFED